MNAGFYKQQRFWRLIILGCIIILFIPTMNWFIRQMVYPAPLMRVSAAPQGMEDLFISFADGVEVHGWLYRQPGGNDSTPIMLFFHGNGENLETLRLSGILADFQNLGAHLLVQDYPGYGRSGGSSSEAALIEAADAAFSWIMENFPENPKIICGWSLGAAVAFRAAAKRSDEINGFIALSPWTSLPDVAAAHYPRWMVNSLLNEEYNSLAAARQIHCPALIIHGEGDQIIPAAQGETVAAAMGTPPRWVKVPRAGHNDLLDRPVVWQEIRVFLESINENE